MVGLWGLVSVVRAAAFGRPLAACRFVRSTVLLLEPTGHPLLLGVMPLAERQGLHLQLLGGARTFAKTVIVRRLHHHLATTAHMILPLVLPAAFLLLILLLLRISFPRSWLLLSLLLCARLHILLMLLLHLLLLQSLELVDVLLDLHRALHVLLVLAREDIVEAVSQVRGQICIICGIVSHAVVSLMMLLLILKVVKLLLSTGRPAELLPRVLDHLGFVLALHVMLIMGLLLVTCSRALMHLVHGLCLRARDLVELLLRALRHELVVQLFIPERLGASERLLFFRLLLHAWLHLLIRPKPFVEVRH